jgi:threonylcarbamoyladenosine tRNA methylthiotransferase MtaB
VSGPDIINFGCRLNIAEGESLRDEHAGDDNLVIVNSCAVTAEAERQARQAIRQTARRRPDARILVTGCAARIKPDAFSAMPEVSGLLNRRVEALDRTPAVSGISHARAFIEVQNGCDHRCTFCIIPYGRGDSRSIRPDIVIDAVKAAVDRGQQEVILTGVDLTSYGADLTDAPPLGRLVKRILVEVPALPRLRLSSLDSAEIDDQLFDLLTSEPRVMPYVHLSLQSGDDMILKRMKRRHSRAQAVDIVAQLKAKRPDISIGADLIAGFPTETETMFGNSVALIRDCDIVFGHVFPYSPRDGTPAARMPQLDRATVKSRADHLRSVANTHRSQWLQTLVGTKQNVLVELAGDKGHAENFATVRLAAALPNSNMRGTMTDILITGTDGATLIGHPA